MHHKFNHQGSKTGQGQSKGFTGTSGASKGAGLNTLDKANFQVANKAGNTKIRTNIDRKSSLSQHSQIRGY
jgi:hypothetical protein